MDQKYKFNDFSLRKFIKDQDEEKLYQALKEPEVVRHMASTGLSKDDCVKIIDESLQHWDQYNIGSWAVEKNKVIIGWAGFKIWKEDEFELLIVLGKDSWGLGLKIYQELIKLAQEEFHLKSLTVILPDTRKSYSYIVQKAGFKHIGSESFNGESFQKFQLSLF